MLLAAGLAPAQSTPETAGCEISSISFKGNATLGKNELLTQMTTKETPGFFNKFLYNTISEKLGRKNEYLDRGTLGADLKRLKSYYVNRGFSDAALDTLLGYDAEGKNVDITIAITEGYRSTIDSLSYRGIGQPPGWIWGDVLSNQKIVAGDPYNSQLLVDEVNRILKILANAGYPNAVFLRDPDSSRATRFASTRNYKVVLTFNPGKMYFFGPITIQQEIDSLRSPLPRQDITDDLIVDQLTFAPGKHYSFDDSLSSANNLRRLGIFDLRRMDMTVPPRSDTSVTVPTRIIIRPKDKHELAPELIMSDDNGSFNIGAGLGYTQNNFFGGARIFTARLRFRTQTINAFPNYFGRNTDAVSNLDMTYEVVQPYVFSPKVKGTWAFSLIVDKEQPYLQNIARNKFGFSTRLAEHTTGFLDWTLEGIGSLKNNSFRGDTTDPEIRHQIQLLQQAQFNSILSFAIQRDMTNDVFSPSEGFVHSGSIDESGLFPLALKSVFTNIPFTQFYRITLQGRWYDDLSSHRFSILAFKLRGGFEDKYGESRSDPNRGIPLTHRFYAGGSNSVRGWNSRDLIASGDPQLGGNVSFEGSLELRTNILQALQDGLFDKFWIVEFVDAGNVWQEAKDFRVRQIAIAAGVGIHYDTFFGPFRIDWGFRVYNPAEPTGRQWISQRQLFGQTFKEAIFHFGIGNAF